MYRPETHGHLQVLHGNEVHCDRAAMWEVPCDVKYPGNMWSEEVLVADTRRTYQLPLPHPRSTTVFVTPGVSSAKISGSTGGYLPITSMNMMC